MDKFECGGWKAHERLGDFYECPRCGNHVCADCAKNNRFLCPHCFAGLSPAN